MAKKRFRGLGASDALHAETVRDVAAEAHTLFKTARKTARRGDCDSAFRTLKKAMGTQVGRFDCQLASIAAGTGKGKVAKLLKDGKAEFYAKYFEGAPSAVLYEVNQCFAKQHGYAPPEPTHWTKVDLRPARRSPLLEF